MNLLSSTKNEVTLANEINDMETTVIDDSLASVTSLLSSKDSLAKIL